MTRQIQIRRGTTAEHEEFIGAIGEITMDTDVKTLRVHDGITAGGFLLARTDDTPKGDTLPEGCDIVIETWRASDGKSWYRKYQSGWIEQGGLQSVAKTTGTVVTFQVPMFFDNIFNSYNVFYSPIDTVGSYSYACSDMASESMRLRHSATGGSVLISWKVEGMQQPA